MIPGFENLKIYKFENEARRHPISIFNLSCSIHHTAILTGINFQILKLSHFQI